MSRILVVDDEQNICELLTLYLVKEGHTAETAADGEEALRKFQSFGPDLILLDIMLPKKDGWQVCREVRKTSDIPIIMLTAKGDVSDRVTGLEMGADDYIVKPFEILELVARVKAVLRRYNKSNNQEEKTIQDGCLVLNKEEHSVFINQEKINLTIKEFSLLEILLSTQRKVFTREELLSKVWGMDFAGETRTVDVHIAQLRKKLDFHQVIRTVSKTGYRLEEL